tara:strand:+ start:544 stop:969 length:426 start_codon:yes stop_codon:yes gene_type:complete
MDIKIKNSLFIYLACLIGLVFSNSLNITDYNQSHFSNDLLNLNKLNHNFNFSMGTQSSSLGTSSYYSIGDKVTYNFSEKLMFIGDFNLVTSSIGFNQVENSFNNPMLNFDIGLNYKLNETTNFQLRIVKNSLNPNCNSVAY